ncbi:flavin monoamine oxidase family protein [Streptococcus loxodontisalivarius]|uniref:Monoamine oxidase n=1 Tax=Streptococcus loxodontisalivarius TaxID=1349415 RepID=A0ABS2PRL8_9STRE|nr:FAD-dependent oxidoreductase [Streptococcus loxodontisalivarius]MBM7642689.1 monoamine oxidase [Streptococcus loxodontisalivarius]
MKTIIIGGGLAGLYAAYRLQKAGQDYLLLEASDHFGGRASGWAISETNELELGATWVWKDFNPTLFELLDELGLTYFDHPAGATIYDSKVEGKSILNRPYSAGQRLVGGMPQLIKALVKRLNPHKLHLNQAVSQVTLKGKLLVTTADQQFVGDRLFLAIPPRLAAQRINFQPSLPDDVMSDWSEQETWMAPHAKLIYHFDRPFWRKQGLTGDVISDAGPMFEIHDISDEAGQFGALFGFSSLSPDERSQLTDQEQLEAGLVQLEGYFGSDIRKYLKASLLKDWTQDTFLATEADKLAKGHQFKSAQAVASGAWKYQLRGIASEFSPSYPGYLAGALEATDLAL